MGQGFFNECSHAIRDRLKSNNRAEACLRCLSEVAHEPRNNSSSPKLNGAVERAQRTHTEEFYQVTNCPPEKAALNREVREWEKTYNTVRPHQSLGYLSTEIPFVLERPSSVVLLRIGFVTAFDFAVYLWASGRDVAMGDFEIGKMPGELWTKRRLSV